MGFVREKRTICGTMKEHEFIEIDLFQLADMRKRGKKGKIARRKSSPKQIKENEKNRLRYLIQKANTNFGEGDFFMHLTYASWCRPKTKKDAKKIFSNYIRRINRECDRQKIAHCKYISVLESKKEKEDGTVEGVHHHVLIRCGLSRDTMEDLWRARKRKGEKKGRHLGYVNIDRLQPDEHGIEAAVRYMMKQKGAINEKSWTCSQGLKEPIVKKNDYKYSHRKLEALSSQTDNAMAWEKEYPGYIFTDAQSNYSDELGWHITVKMRKEKNGKKCSNYHYDSGQAAKFKRVCKSMQSKCTRRK